MCQVTVERIGVTYLFFVEAALYAVFLPRLGIIKTSRVVSWAIEEQKAPEAGPEQYVKDPDGYAKAALIAINRSIDAWGAIHKHFPCPDIHDILTHLIRLGKRVKK